MASSTILAGNLEWRAKLKSHSLSGVRWRTFQESRFIDNFPKVHLYKELFKISGNSKCLQITLWKRFGLYLPESLWYLAIQMQTWLEEFAVFWWGELQTRTKLIYFYIFRQDKSTIHRSKTLIWLLWAKCSPHLRFSRHSEFRLSLQWAMFFCYKVGAACTLCLLISHHPICCSSLFCLWPVQPKLCFQSIEVKLHCQPFPLLILTSDKS